MKFHLIIIFQHFIKNTKSLESVYKFKFEAPIQTYLTCKQYPTLLLLLSSNFVLQSLFRLNFR